MQVLCFLIHFLGVILFYDSIKYQGTSDALKAGISLTLLVYGIRFKKWKKRRQAEGSAVRCNEVLVFSIIKVFSIPLVLGSVPFEPPSTIRFQKFMPLSNSGCPRGRRIIRQECNKRYEIIYDFFRY